VKICYFVTNFGRPFVKRLALCRRTVVLSCLSCLSVCNVGVLWPNGWMDKNETWHGGMPRPRRHCVRWGLSCPPPRKGYSPQFSAHVRCGQMAEWIKMPLGMEVGLGPGVFVLDGDPALPKRGTAHNFRPMSTVAKRLDGSKCHLVRRYASAQATLC